ncbi:Mlr2412 protein [Photobacterium aphoticum]|uniref:Mlr2412 protein n=1 Tax=Photobacterium aphoticum TaxID=754436 RepID=A0A090R3I5_9GAMM|nr:Mlr2412 protein [Photobacterium aphoticum]
MAPVAAAATAIAVDEVLADELFTQVTERDLTVSDSVEATPSLNQPEPDIASEPDLESAPAPVQEPEPEPELEPEGSFDVDTSAFTVESESQHDDAFVSDEDMSVPESAFAPEPEPALAPEPAVAEGYVFEDPVVEDLVAESVAEPVVEQAVEPVSVDADAEQESELAEMPAQPEVTETADIEPDVLPQTEASEPVPATPYGSDDEQAELEALLAASFTEEDAAAMDPSVGMTVEQLLESLDVNAPLDLSDYPEFDEEAAMNAPDAELDDTPQMDVSPDEEQAVFDNIVRQLQQAAEAAERPQTAASVNAFANASANVPVEEMADAAVQEADAPDVSVSDVPFADDNAEVPESTLDLGYDDEAEPSAFGLHGQPQVAFETYDAASLPEFGEDDALQASFDEQHELEQYELEQGLGQAQSSALEAAANTPSSPAAPLSPEAEAVRDSMELPA